MAGLKQKIKAYTLVENLVSMSLITIMIVLSFMIFNLKSTNTYADHQVHLKADEIFQQIANGELSARSQEIKTDEYIIDIEVRAYPGNNQLDQISISVWKEDKVIHQINHLLLHEED